MSIMSFFTAILTAISFFFSSFPALFNQVSTVDINVDTSAYGEEIPNVVDNINVWHMGTSFYNAQRNEENDVFEFVKYVQLMQCTGGTADRDLFLDPYDTTTFTDYKFEPLIENCRGILKLGVYSKEIAEYPIDFTPVDECADAYVRLALHNRVNNIYNLYNPQLFTVEKLGKKFFKRFKRVSRDVFEKTVKESIADEEVVVLSFYSSIASTSKNVPMSNEFTVNELDKLGFKWSKIGVRYLSHMKKIR